MLHFLDLGQDLRSQRESVLPSLQGGCMANNRHVMFIIPHLQVMCSSSSCSKTCALLYHQHRYHPHPHHQYQVLSLYICKACVPLFESRGGGSAVFVSSIGGFQVIPLDHHHQYPYLIFVTDTRTVSVEKKSVMWRNFKFLNMADEEKSKISPHVD